MNAELQPFADKIIDAILFVEQTGVTPEELLISMPDARRIAESVRLYLTADRPGATLWDLPLRVDPTLREGRFGIRSRPAC